MSVCINTPFIESLIKCYFRTALSPHYFLNNKRLSCSEQTLRILTVNSSSHQKKDSK